MIRFDAKTQIIISEELSQDIVSIIHEEKAERIGIIIDENVANLKNVKKLVEELNSKAKLFLKVIKAFEPTTGMVNEISSWFRGKKIEFFIGIGGGSIIDLTKAVSVMVVNQGPVEDYHGTGKEIKGAVRKMMIPTTAGTGSEVTPGAVLVNKKTKFKRALSGRHISPDYAVLNAALTLSMPDNVTAATGMDALAHAIESYTARNSNCITRMYSKEAFSLVFNNLQNVLGDKNNIAIRKNILLGANLAGFAIYNSNTGACHSLAYPLGIYNKVPHGVAVALILPKVIEINVEKGCYIYSDLYDLIEDRDVDVREPIEKAHKFCQLLKEYTPLNYLKTELRDYGVDEANYEFLAERGLDLTSALSNNPVDFTLEDSKKVFKELIKITNEYVMRMR